MPLSGNHHDHLAGDTIATSVVALLAGALSIFGDLISSIDGHIELILQWLTGISLIFLILRHILALAKGKP